MAQQNGSASATDQKEAPVGSGTVDGLMAFFDFLIQKKIATASAVTPLRSAAKQVFELVEGTDDIGSMDVRGLEVENYLDRFQVGAIQTGRYKPESIQAYRKRFTRGVDYYRTYLTTGAVPKIGIRSSVTRNNKPPSPAKTSAVAAEEHVPAVSPPSADTEGSGRHISYPFPLQGGGIATLHLPVRLEKADAERLATFIRTLVIEPQRELPPPSRD
jgi:hypothetical protein